MTLADRAGGTNRGNTPDLGGATPATAAGFGPISGCSYRFRNGCARQKRRKEAES